MPQMGVSVSEGTITKWLKQEGEQIAADEPLLEISTDKVDTEVPSPGEGVVQQILVQEGETVDVGTKLAVIAPDGAEAPAAGPQAPETAEPEPEPAAEAPAPEPEPQPEPTPQSPAAAPERAPATDGAGEKTFVSPVVARIASEHGVDVSQVPGTGRGGRVTKKDIVAFVESGQAAAPAATPAPEAPPAAPAEAPAPEAPAPPPPAAPLRAPEPAMAQAEPGAGETF